MMVIAVVALFLLNLNGALAAGDDNAWHGSASATTLSSSPASIGDYVWDDQNGDGEQGTVFDVGINGVVVELYKDGVWQENFTTQNNPDTGDPGWYLFENLDAGNYVVKVADSNFESGGTLHDYALTTDNNPLSVHLGEGDAYGEADFGYEALASPAGSEPTAVTLTSFATRSRAASSVSQGAFLPWSCLVGLTALGMGSVLWVRRRFG